MLMAVAPAQVSFTGGVGTQAPMRQVFPAVQTRPHTPQLALSVCRLAQVPESMQNVVGGAQIEPQVPAEHAVPGPHTVAQLPQCALVLEKSVSQPLSGAPSQLPKPGRHIPRPQALPVQDATAWARATQALPHIPQLAAVVRRSVSQPLEVRPSQLP